MRTELVEASCLRQGDVIVLPPGAASPPWTIRAIERDDEHIWLTSSTSYENCTYGAPRTFYVSPSTKFRRVVRESKKKGKASRPKADAPVHSRAGLTDAQE